MIIILIFGSSAEEKEENIKTLESLLEKGLIEVANKEEELKVGFLVASMSDRMQRYLL